MKTAPGDELPVDARGAIASLAERPASAASLRAAVLLVVCSLAVFLAVAPFAKVQLPAVGWFIPLFQSVLIINDLITASLLFGQVRLTRQQAVLVLAGGYAYTALMASIHLLTFPGVFSPTGLLGAGAQTTGYLHVFWHVGMAVAVMAYAALRDRASTFAAAPRRAIVQALLAAAALAAALTTLATAGNDLLPRMLSGIHYSSAFNVGRYGQWAVTAFALWRVWHRRTRHSVLDLWLAAMLCNSFFEIALVSIFNAGRYDLGFYAGRVYATVASFVVLVMMLGEQWKIYRELAAAQETARSEAALRESREVLGLAMHGGRMAAWTRDLAAHTSWWSPEVKELTGWPAEVLAGSDNFLFERVHPADRAALQAAMEAAPRPGEEFSVEFRLRHADGHWRWLDARSQASLQEDGHPTRCSA